MKKFLILIIMIVPSLLKAQSISNYIDPLIGSEGLGRVFIGPSCPYGMVKPGPDCGVSQNAGWSKEGRLSGFSQLHVSGTGGGPKYGNILVKFEGNRTSEDVSLGKYSCTMDDGRKAEITTAERASFYRFSGVKNIEFDLQHFLGRSPVPKAREAQQYEDSHLIHLTDSTWQGWQTISGGWNNGAAYTVYFHAVSKHIKPTVTLLKIGISFVSIDKAKRNLMEDIPHWNFELTHKECIKKWEQILGKVQLAEDTPKQQKRMFYTALYHTMLMPVDRTKDDEMVNGKWTNGRCYDDYYAIWDTYRTNTPLITLLDPERETEIANSLLNIYKKTGYMPDARSGNSNGRTQGGSNAEIVIADALAKGLKLDYKLALEAMIKDAEVAPRDDEAEGRGGLKEYNSLGYIPYGIARAGNRTIEYSFNDWAIAQVAKGIQDSDANYDSIYIKYMHRANNWKNLWRTDYVQDGTKGFIMPKNSEGGWLDEVPFGHSKLQERSFVYSPEISYEGPWYCAWWDCFMYEASSWEYSLSVPHDVTGLIDACGGREAFEKRLDTFFEHGYYNVANEPSFLTPMLYHWINKPEKSSARIQQIVTSCYNDSATGLPGNDDSGAMSAWLAFHMIGLYPNAGHDYYLVHTPMLSGVTIKLDNGNILKIRKEIGDVEECVFNGNKLKFWRISHQSLLEGGELIIRCKANAEKVGNIPVIVPSYKTKSTKYLFTYKLHGQTRKFDVDIVERGDTLVFSYGIQRNLKYWQGKFKMTPAARKEAKSISYMQPTDGLNVTLPDNELFGLVSTDIYKQIKKKKSCTWCNTHFQLVDSANGQLHLVDSEENAEMWILDNPQLPIIMKMVNNPVEIDWEVNIL